MVGISYQVGDLFDFQDSDPEFEDWQAACAHALKLSDESDEVYIGVWTGQDDGSELKAIAYLGELFVK